MEPKIRIMRDKRTQLLDQADEIVKAAETAQRALTDDERSKFDQLIEQVTALEGDIQRLSGLAKRRAELGASSGRQAGGVEDPEAGTIGMDDDEARQYSFLRAINAAISGDWSHADLEAEASRAVEKQVGREPMGFYVPNDVLRVSKRSLNVAGATSGANLVATNLQSESFIDMLKNRMVVRQAGATVLGDLVGNLDIPRKVSGATTYWLSETGQATVSDVVLDQVSLTPKIIGAYTEITRKMYKQSSLDAELLLRDDLALQIALGIDLAALHGTGASNQPTGVANVTGVGAVAGGTNGAVPTWPNIVQLETEISQDNADVGRVAYITNAKVRGKLKQTEKATGTANYIWADGSNPLNGYPAYVSNQVRSDLTKGTGSALSAIFFGNWGDLLIGMWGALDVLVDLVDVKSGLVGISAFHDVDIQVRHAQSFAVMLDAITV